MSTDYYLIYSHLFAVDLGFSCKESCGCLLITDHRLLTAGCGPRTTDGRAKLLLSRMVRFHSFAGVSRWHGEPTMGVKNMKKVALIAGIIVVIVILAVLGLAAARHDWTKYPLMITDAGRYRYAAGKTAVDVKKTKDGNLEAFLFKKLNESVKLGPGLPTLKTKGTATLGPIITMTPENRWFVFVESKDRVWLYDGKDQFDLIEQNTMGCTHYDATEPPASKKVPPSLLERMPESMQKRIAESR
jgi:hypothetical protein